MNMRFRLAEAWITVGQSVVSELQSMVNHLSKSLSLGHCCETYDLEPVVAADFRL
jgi:hypothetical protein